MNSNNNRSDSFAAFYAFYENLSFIGLLFSKSDSSLYFIRVFQFVTYGLIIHKLINRLTSGIFLLINGVISQCYLHVWDASIFRLF